EFIKQAGIRRMYDGCDAVICRQFLSWASFLVSYDKATELMIKNTGKKSGEDLSVTEKFIVGAAAGAVNVAVVGPIDVVKTQMQKLDPVNGKYSFEAIKAIRQQYGINAFTTGIPIKTLRSSWYAGISLLVMDK